MSPLKYLLKETWDNYVLYVLMTILSAIGLAGAVLTLNPGIETRRPDEELERVMRRRNEDEKIQGKDLQRILANRPLECVD